MSTPFRRMMAVLGSIMFLTVGWAHAADDADKAAVQGVISRQLDAFKHDDATAAYGFAAPAIQKQFDGSASFMEMVKRSYAPVYRPKSTTFGKFAADGKSFTQALTIVDANGQVWDAVYSLERGPDGQLRISGCGLIKSAEIST